MDENGAVRFWSLAESREVKCFIQQRCLLLQWFTDIRPHVHVTQMALSPEGNKVLTATRRGKIRVWSAAR